MKPLHRTKLPQSEVDRVAAETWQRWESGHAEVRKCLGEDRAQALSNLRDVVLRAAEGDVFINDLYQVLRKELPGGWLHLSIKRLDKESCHDWRHFQQIKDEVAGPMREAVELYPAFDRVVDMANQYHLWVAPEGFRFPFGFKSVRAVSADTNGTQAKQRPFETES